MKTKILHGLMAFTSLLCLQAQPHVTRQPTNQSVSLGASATFAITASGSAPLSYQWLFNTQPIALATNRVLTLTNVSSANAGGYTIAVSDSTGLTNSSAAHLEVDATFTKIVNGSMVNDPADSEGMMWVDYDGDGLLDLFVGTGGAGPRSFLYRNNGDGTFANMPAATVGSLVKNGAEDSAWGDYDNDGFLDLFVTTDSGPSWLYHNKGNGTFENISAGSMLAGNGTRHRGCAWADYDGDGNLDLFTTTQNRLYRNNGDGTFAKITNSTFNTAAATSTCVWGDYNNDGRPDLFLGTDTRNFLYRNDGNGVFTAMAASDVGSIVSNASQTGIWGDYDNDGYLDLWTTAAFGVAGQHLYHNNRAGGFTEVTAASLGAALPRGVAAAWGDYDNDGYLDLFVSNSSANLLYHNNGDGTFTQIKSGSIVTDAALYGEDYSCTWGDYDNDGFLDLAVGSIYAGTPAPVFLYRNNGNSNAWIKIKCVGTVSNRAAIGAKIHVRATIGGKTFWQLREISGGGGYGGQNLLGSFGLGDATNIDLVRIEWPSGMVQELTNVAARQQLTVYEPSHLSSPLPGTLDIRGRKGVIYRLEGSEDLRNWSALGTQLNTNGTVSFADPEFDRAQHRFYRSAELMVPIDAQYAGLSYSDWTVRWWQWTYATFSTTNTPPFGQNGTNFTSGQSGSVWFLAFPDSPTTVRDVTLPAGKALLFPCTAFDSLLAAFLSGFPVNSIDEFRPLVEGWSQSGLNPGLEIDGMRIENLTSHKVISGPFTVTLPANNVQGLSPGDHFPEFQAGYWFLLAPLPSGPHIIHFYWDNANGPFAGHYDETYHVMVLPDSAATHAAAFLDGLELEP